MEELYKCIQNIRFANQNFEGRYFVPEADLVDALSELAIEQCLGELGFPAHEIQALKDAILRGARKCFAILISIRRGEAIPGFFRRDSLQQSHPDDRLPYTSEALQQIFGEDATTVTIREFLDKQWEFAIPIMHQQMIFREFDTEVIWPFLHEEPAGRGSMGTAWKIEVHPQCHRLPLGDHKVIRKQIECGQTDDISIFQKELRNLSLLTYLEHPNIVQLYCSYIHRQRYNLIFAVADGGSLADLLNGKQTSKKLEGDQFLLALAGLADAINAMHNFTSKALDLSLTGCHHDLAPRNILIHGEALLLADFGLSTFRNTEEDSLTTFKEARSSYIAPECLTVDESDIEPEKVGRASDIWSFGCILAEVLTYMVEGPVGVKQFREKRKVLVSSGIEWSRFHRGPGKPNDEVTAWLNNLQAKEKPYSARMVGLIRKMLAMDPNERPRSVQVLTALRGISILSIASSVDIALESVCNGHQSIDRTLGKMRFQSWLFAFNKLLDETDRNERNEQNKIEFSFPEIVEALKETQRVLAGSGEWGNSASYQSLLRYQHTRLIEALPLRYRSVAKEHLVKQVLQSDVEQLGRLSTAIAEAGDEDIGILAAVKHLTALDEAGRLTEQENLLLKREDITQKGEIDIHSLGLLEPNSEPVLVEWLKYNESWTDEYVGTELLGRLASIVSLLHAESTTHIPGSLHCKGFFHDASFGAFGVIHSLPLLGLRPITLHGLLRKEKSYCPLLEDRFRLAWDICQCIYTFHEVGWLHRNLHPMNVLFFPQEGVKDAEWAKEPRILGFAKSRENRPNSFTHGADNDRQLRIYQHPKYLLHQERYREEFDYYSVGMLLLEIGLWKPFFKITDSERLQALTDEELMTEVIATRVPYLGVTMGTRYMEATRACLDGSLAEGREDSGDLAVTRYMSFKRLVMDRIRLIE